VQQFIEEELIEHIFHIEFIKKMLVNFATSGQYIAVS
jgi:hypothetical protein